PARWHRPGRPHRPGGWSAARCRPRCRGGRWRRSRAPAAPAATRRHRWCGGWCARWSRRVLLEVVGHHPFDQGGQRLFLIDRTMLDPADQVGGQIHVELHLGLSHASTIAAGPAVALWLWLGSWGRWEVTVAVVPLRSAARAAADSTAAPAGRTDHAAGSGAPAAQ